MIGQQRGDDAFMVELIELMSNYVYIHFIWSRYRKL